MDGYLNRTCFFENYDDDEGKNQEKLESMESFARVFSQLSLLFVPPKFLSSSAAELHSHTHIFPLMFVQRLSSFPFACQLAVAVAATAMEVNRKNFYQQEKVGEEGEEKTTRRKNRWTVVLLSIFTTPLVCILTPCLSHSLSLSPTLL